MRYIVQLCTGSFSHSVLKPEEVVSTLEYCMRALEVEKVIFGWAPDASLNKTISGLLDTYHVEKYLWLPVFAEIQTQDSADSNESIAAVAEQEVSKFAGDTFEFACQSSPGSLRRAEEVFDQLTEGYRVDGVFLDRIRYASAANSRSALFGCWCPRCRKLYEAEGIDTERLQRMAREMNPGSLPSGGCGADPGSMMPGGCEADPGSLIPDSREGFIYRYRDQDIDGLMQVKRRIISQQVKTLCSAFRSRGLKIGADTFAPSVADLVGQDLAALGAEADFIKPMVYLRTNAPAGVPFELGGLGNEVKQRLDQLWGGDTSGMELTVRQMQMLMEQNVRTVPGIDVNRVENICTSDIDYVREYLKRLKAVGTETVVLSWDIMHISRDTIDALADL